MGIAAAAAGETPIAFEAVLGRRDWTGGGFAARGAGGNGLAARGAGGFGGFYA